MMENYIVFFPTDSKADQLLGLKCFFISLGLRIDYMVDYMDEEEQDISDGFLSLPSPDNQDLPPDIMADIKQTLEVLAQNKTQTKFIIASHTKKLYYLVSYDENNANMTAMYEILSPAEIKGMLEDMGKSEDYQYDIDMLDKIWANSCF